MRKAEIVISGPTAKKPGVVVGDRVVLDTLLGKRTLRVGGITEEFLSATACVSLSEATKVLT